jgi:hypothetical protein
MHRLAPASPPLPGKFVIHRQRLTSVGSTDATHKNDEITSRQKEVLPQIPHRAWNTSLRIDRAAGINRVQPFHSRKNAYLFRKPTQVLAP